MNNFSLIEYVAALDDTIGALRKRSDAAVRAQRIDKVIAEVNAHFGVTFEQMTGRDNSRAMTAPLRALCYTLNKVVGVGVTEIGALINRHHSTAIHHIKQAGDARELHKDPRLRAFLTKEIGLPTRATETQYDINAPLPHPMTFLLMHAHNKYQQDANDK